MQTTFIIASMAIFGAMASPAPSPMGVEVIRQDGQTMVREVVSFNDIRDFDRRAELTPASLVERPIMHQLRSRRW